MEGILKKPIIETSGLTKIFKKLTAVDSVDVKIYPGEYIALLGPNGAGKTTFVEMIEGVQKPSEGTVYIEGKDWLSHERELRHILGVSFQETQFMDKVTAHETLSLFAGFYGAGKERVEELLLETELVHKRDTYVSDLSGGQRQKLAIAIALINHPKVLLLDEPTTGLDPRARREIWQLLTRLKDRGTTMILTTHYMEEAEFLCDHIFMMYEGRIIACGTLDELLEGESERNRVEVSFAGKIPEKLRNLADVYKVVIDEGRLVVRILTNDTVDVLKRVLEISEENGAPGILNIDVRSMTLDDLFIQMTGRRLHE